MIEPAAIKVCWLSYFSKLKPFKVLPALKEARVAELATGR